MGHRLPEVMWQALDYMGPCWEAGSCVPMVWLVLPDVKMHKPATSLLFNRPFCKPHQTVVQATHIASRGCDADCDLGSLFVWIPSPFVNSEKFLPVKSSSWLDREGKEGWILLSLLCSSWLRSCLFWVPQIFVILNAQWLEVGRTHADSSHPQEMGERGSLMLPGWTRVHLGWPPLCPNIHRSSLDCLAPKGIFCKEGDA